MKPTRVLVVDDNPVNLKLAVSVLESAGYEIFQANDAVEAMASVRRSPPELILMDLAMPGVDGLTLTRRLKSDPATQPIRIVALTASAMKGDDAKALDAGCDGYISKPIDTRKLPEQVAGFLGRIERSEVKNERTL